MALLEKTIEQVSNSREPYVTITQGMRGVFAVHMWWNAKDGGFWEPMQTGASTFRANRDGRALANVDAKRWAEAEGIAYVSG